MDSIDYELEALKYAPAMEMSTVELTDIIGGRRELFNRFYPDVAKGMRSKGNQFLRAVAKYRDRNIEILSSPNLTDYCVFGVEDQRVVWDVTGINEADVADELKKLKDAIGEGCTNRGYTKPTSMFQNLTPLRVILLFMMRYYLERGEKDKLEEVCAYTGYSMFYTLFRNFFPWGIRPETMAYTMNQLTKKHKLKQEGSVDGLLTYSVSRCAYTYRQRILTCSDHDIIYVVGQFKSRSRDYFKSIAQVYHASDVKKEAIFTSIDRVDTEEGREFIERDTKAGEIEALSREYTSRFFQKPVDDELINLAAKLNEISRLEIKNALVALRADKARIPQLQQFYKSIFYLYLVGDDSHDLSVHSKKFMAAMDSIYKRGNAKDKNIVAVKKYLDSWLDAVSASYRETNRGARLNGFRKAIFQYFVFAIALR